MENPFLECMSTVLEMNVMSVHEISCFDDHASTRRILPNHVHPVNFWRVGSHINDFQCGKMHTKPLHHWCFYFWNSRTI